MQTLARPTETESRPAGQPWSMDAAAEFLQVCRRTLDNYVRKGHLKAIRIGTRVLLPDSEVRRIAECGI